MFLNECFYTTCMGTVRKPSNSGYIPQSKSKLERMIKESFTDPDFGIGKDLRIGVKGKNEKRNVLGGVSPHAGYVYSGSGTAHTFQSIFQEGVPDTIIILGTQHTGYYDVGLMKEGIWQTPLGDIMVDEELGQLILDQGPAIREDNSAFTGYPHGREHNIEIQITFILYAAYKASKDIKITPIKIGAMDPNRLLEVGLNIAKAIRQSELKDIAVIASSDLEHYSPNNPRNPKKEIEEVQKARDMGVIEAFKLNDWKMTYEKARHTSACGPQTIATLLIIGKELGYTKAKALKYYTSFEKRHEATPCDYSVGYFSGIITN